MKMPILPSNQSSSLSTVGWCHDKIAVKPTALGERPEENMMIEQVLTALDSCHVKSNSSHVGSILSNDAC